MHSLINLKQNPRKCTYIKHLQGFNFGGCNINHRQNVIYDGIYKILSFLLKFLR